MRDKIIPQVKNPNSIIKNTYHPRNGANPDIQDTEGDTALIMAVNEVYTDIASLLIDHGAQINIDNNYNHTALWLAIRNHDAMIEDQIAFMEEDFSSLEDLLADLYGNPYDAVQDSLNLINLLRAASSIQNNSKLKLIDDPGTRENTPANIRAENPKFLYFSSPDKQKSNSEHDHMPDPKRKKLNPS